jgi:hypothetical protein
MLIPWSGQTKVERSFRWADCVEQQQKALLFSIVAQGVEGKV